MKTYSFGQKKQQKKKNHPTKQRMAQRKTSSFGISNKWWFRRQGIYHLFLYHLRQKMVLFSFFKEWRKAYADSPTEHYWLFFGRAKHLGFLLLGWCQDVNDLFKSLPGMCCAMLIWIIAGGWRSGRNTGCIKTGIRWNKRFVIIISCLGGLCIKSVRSFLKFVWGD